MPFKGRNDVVCPSLNEIKAGLYLVAALLLSRAGCPETRRAASSIPLAGTNSILMESAVICGEP